MSPRCTIVRLLPIALLLIPLGASLAAHDVEPFVELNARLAGDRLQVDVRLPAEALADANVRRDAEGRIIGADADEALVVVGRGIAADLAVEQDGVPLIPVETSAAPSADSTAGLVTLTYVVRGAGEDLSARLHAFQVAGQTIRTRAVYRKGDEPPRTYLIGGAAERVVFEPRAGQTLQRFVRLGTDVLLRGGGVLLFVLCLAVPTRRPGAVRRAMLCFLAAETAGALWSASPIAPVFMTSTTVTLMAATVAASAVVLIAAQALVNPQSRGLSALALIFGAATGIDLGHTFFDQAAYAGTHAALALSAFLGVLVLGHVWMAALVSSVSGLLPRWGVPAWLTSVAVSIFTAHSALHRLSAAGAQLATGESALLDHWMVILTLTWAVAILIAGIVDSWQSGRWTSEPPARLSTVLGDLPR